MVWATFFSSAGIIVLAASKLADYGDVIAERTRLGGMFVGTLLMAEATSLPELLTAVNSAHLGVVDLTIGDIFGSSMFNMLMLTVLDLFYYRKRILRRVAMTHALSAGQATILMGMVLAGLLGLVMTALGGLGNLARVERRLLFLEIDAASSFLPIFLVFGCFYIATWYKSPVARFASRKEVRDEPFSAESL
jgi:Ca2+/Na+ antiporter